MHAQMHPRMNANNATSKPRTCTCAGVYDCTQSYNMRLCEIMQTDTHTHIRHGMLLNTFCPPRAHIRAAHSGHALGARSPDMHCQSTINTPPRLGLRLKRVRPALLVAEKLPGRALAGSGRRGQVHAKSARREYVPKLLRVHGPGGGPRVCAPAWPGLACPVGRTQRTTQGKNMARVG